MSQITPKQNQFSIVKILKVILRWPYLFMLPIFLVAITLFLYTSSFERFRSSAIILFETSYIPVEEYFTLLDKFDDRPMNVVRSLLFGKPAGDIVDAVWPNAKNNPIERNGLVESLRSGGGVSLKFQRDNPSALSISYDSNSPDLAYSVVNATVKALVNYNRELTNQRIDNATQFIEKELTKSSQDISELEQKIVRVRTGLPESVLQNSDRDTSGMEKLLDLNAVDYNVEDSLIKGLHFDESPTQIKSSLEIANKELAQLELDFANKSYLDNPEDLEIALNATQDLEVSRIRASIIDKQQKLSELQSKGFLSAHPDVSILEKEIKNLRQMKHLRLMDLQKSSNKENPELTKLKLEKIHFQKIQDKKQQIQSFEDRLQAANAYAEKFKDKTITLDDKLKELSDRKSNLLELENRRLVASHSFAQMTKRLEVLKREARVDQRKFGLTVKVAELPNFPQQSLPYAGAPIIFIGTVVTGLILFALAALIATFENSIQNSTELAQLLTIPVIGSIDSFRSVEDQENSTIRLRLTLLFLILYFLILYLVFKR